jgi:hypothetical protein
MNYNYFSKYQYVLLVNRTKNFIADYKLLIIWCDNMSKKKEEKKEAKKEVKKEEKKK